MNELLVYVAPAISLIVGVFIGRGRRLVSQEALANLGRDIPSLLQDYEDAKRRASEYLSKIEEVIVEREVWRELYNDQASGHDNAQALMMQTINALVVGYRKKTGETPKIDPIIETVRGEWVGKHGPEIRETRGDDGRHRKDSEEKPS